MSLNDGSTRNGSKRRGFWLLSIVAAVVLAGCGESNPLSGLKVYPVKGKVTLPDGKPLDSGKISFAATKSTITSTANIERDGSFTFKGGANGDGLPEGEYKVRLEVDGPTHAKKGTTPFPSKYLDEESSDLTATVKPDEASNNFDLKLTPNSPSSTSASSRGVR
jgi:hypothetical protein